MEPFIGQITMFGGNYPIQGWALCQGQLMSISENTALFSIIGTAFGGDGVTTFALPDLRGSVSIQAGQAPGQRLYSFGEKAGSSSVSLTSGNLPATNVVIPCNAGNATTDEPTGNYPATTSANTYATSGGDMLAMGTLQGGNIPINNMPPYLALNYIIALEGIYPSRS